MKTSGIRLLTLFLLAVALVTGCKSDDKEESGESAESESAEEGEEGEAEEGEAEEGEGEERAAEEGDESSGDSEADHGAEGEGTQLAAPVEGPCDRSTATEITENIEEDTVLPVGACAKISNVLHVNAVLNIMQGSTLLFENQAALFVSGSGAITANGSEAQPIVLKGVVDAPGYWRGVVILSPNPVNKLSHVQILNAGGDKYRSRFKAALYAGDKGKLNLSNVTISGADSTALGLADSAILTGFQNVTLNCEDDSIATLSASQLGGLNGTLKTEKTDGYVTVNPNALAEEATWAALPVPYRFSGQPHVTAPLTIEAGATLTFTPDSALWVSNKGSLVVKGTADSKVTFKGSQEATGLWRGVVLDSPNPLNSIEHAIFRDAGGSKYRSREPAGLYLSNKTRLKLANSEFRNNSGWGFVVHDQAQLERFENNAFADNEKGAVLTTVTQAAVLDAGSSYGGGVESPSDGARVWVMGGDLSDTAEWAALDSPWFIEAGAVHVNSGLTIAPGAVLKFGQKGVIWSQNAIFTAKGTAEEPIVFRAANEAQPWTGLIFDGGRAELSHVTLSHAGGRKYRSREPAALYVNSKGTLALDNATITNSAGWGVYVEDGGKVDPPIEEAGAGFTFTDNATGNVKLPE